MVITLVVRYYHVVAPCRGEVTRDIEEICGVEDVHFVVLLYWQFSASSSFEFTGVVTCQYPIITSADAVHRRSDREN